MKSNTVNRILSAVVFTVLAMVSAAVLSCLWGTGQGVYAAANKLQITNSTVYVQSGTESIVKISVKNTTNSQIKGVTMAEGYRSMDIDDEDWITGSSSRTTTDPTTGYTDTWDRFTTYFERDGYNAENAVWDDEEEGYTIGANQTAKLWFKVKSSYEGPGTYNEWIKLGNTHTDWYCDFLPITILDEEYTGEAPVTVVTYNPANAAITMGTSENAGAEIATVALGSTIDFGTINLSGNTGFTREKTYYTRNTSPTGPDEHGNSSDIQVGLSVINQETAGQEIEYPFGCNSNMMSNMSWGPLPAAPMNATSFYSAQTGIVLDVTNYVEGTYNATFKLTTTPHGVKVNGGTVHNNGIYTWPVKVKLTGTNPRIPKAPKNVVATPGNGQVEITWQAGENAKDGGQYGVWRREGTETNIANLNKATFDWSKYEPVGSDMPDDEGNYLFIDGTAENNKTYTYIVIGDTPLQAYPAVSQSVKPLASYNSKIQKPYVFGPDDKLNGVELEWCMNDNYGSVNNDGSSLVDHFNIYRNGELVAQINQNAVMEETNYEYHYTSYRWKAFVKTPINYQDYTWNVAAVSKSGVEGYWSDDVAAHGNGERVCMISGHNASARLTWGQEAPHPEKLFNEMELKVTTDSSQEKVEYWRAVGTNAPDTSQAPYYSKTDTTYDVDTTLIDEDVDKGKTYTYTARVTDSEGCVSDFYTFRIKVPTGSEWEKDDFSSPDMTWSVINKGKKLHMDWHAASAWTWDRDYYLYGSYTVYRNDKAIKTFTAGGDGDSYMEFEDDPGADGTYVYRMDQTIHGITVRSEEYTFVRNTVPTDENTLLKPPSTPLFHVSISEGKPVLRWAPTGEGGEIEGYHFYRKDAGEYVNGTYKPDSEPSLYRKYWDNKRYITISDPDTMALVDTAGDYQGDEAKGYLEGVNWAEDNCPHEYWITAYNQAGESEPSSVFSFGFQGLDDSDWPIAPTNSYDRAPLSPTITQMWVDWQDNSDQRQNWDIDTYGYIRVAWDDAESTKGIIDNWEVAFSGLDYSSSQTRLEAWEAATDPGATQGTSRSYSPYCLVNSQYAKGDSVTAQVTAKNSAGDSAPSTAVSGTVNSFPRFRVIPDNRSVLLQWTDLYSDTKDASTQVTGWKIWRKREHGSWELCKTFTTGENGDLDYDMTGDEYVTDENDVKNYSYRDEGVTNGWVYQYKVVPICTDGDSHASVVRVVTPSWTASSVAPGAPQNLTFTKVDGEVVFNWDEPATGKPQYYRLIWEETGKDGHGNEWKWLHEVSITEAPSTCMTWSCETEGTYRFAVYAYSTINGKSLPEVDIDEELDGFDDPAFATRCPSASNVVTVTLTDDDVQALAAEPPGSFEVTATAGEDGITLNWTESARATFYEICRYEVYNQDADFTTVTVPSSVNSYLDSTVLPGVRYSYLIYAKNHYDIGVPSNEVYAVSTGKSKDQILAEEVSGMIDGLPEPDAISTTNLAEIEPSVNQAKEAYDGLTDRQRSLIDTDKRDKLTACVEKVENLRLNQAYLENVLPVQAAIDEIPDVGELTIEDEDAVIGARAQYNALPADAKKLVNTSKLTAAEKKIKELKKAAQDQQIVDSVISDLNALASMDAVDETNAEDILNETGRIQCSINSLDDDQKKILNNTQGIEDLLNKLSETDAKAKLVLGLEHDHIPEYREASEATCSAEGHIACYQCKVCGTCFYDQACSSEVDPDDAVIPIDKSKHKWGKWIVKKEPTCTDIGVQSRNCAYCHQTETLPISKTSHVWSTTPVDDPVLEDGYYVYTYQCSNPKCKATRTGKVKETAVGSQCGVNHNWDWEHPNVTKKPTCSANGTIEYHCKECDGTILETTEIDPAAHDWGEWYKDPDATCTEPGKLVRVCKHNDEHTEEQVIDPTGHDWSKSEVVIAADCTNSGLKKTTCSKCGDTRWETIPVDDSKHDWGSWTRVKNPTYKTKGQDKRTCQRDPDHVQFRDVAVLVCNPAVYLSQSDFTWNNKEQRAGVTVKVDGKTLRNNTDYTVQYASGCKNIGQYSVKVVLRGSYPGVSRIVYFRINPKGTSLGKLTKKKKSIAVKWKKQTSKMGSGTINGYQIQCSMNKSFASGVKTVNVGGAKKTSRTIKGLKAKKTYYVRIRTYKRAGGRTFYSPWSGVKKVKTK